MADLCCRSYSQYVEEADYSQLQPEGDYSLYTNHVEPSPRQPRWASRLPNKKTKLNKTTNISTKYLFKHESVLMLKTLQLRLP